MSGRETQSPALEGAHPALVPGHVIAGKFRIERVLGIGGMGAVAAATHLQLDELVAIKILLPKLAANPEYAARFQREARAAVKIKSEHVVRVLDVGVLDDGCPYMVMEYLQGMDLAQLVQEVGPLEPSIAATYVIHACHAIAAAHALDVVHRDLKPGNLFLADSSDGASVVKVLDFGISKVGARFSLSGPRLTQTAAVMGSPLYMAPEQMQSAKTADARSDVWALGCVLFELVVGQPPFMADTVPGLCSLVLTEPAPLPSRLRFGVPQEIDSIVQRCLEKAPDDRFQTVAELAAALLPLAPNETALVDRILRRSLAPPAARSSHTEVMTPPEQGRKTETAWGQRTGARLAKRYQFGAVAVLGLVGLAIAWFLLRPHAEHQTGPAPAPGEGSGEPEPAKQQARPTPSPTTSHPAAATHASVTESTAERVPDPSKALAAPLAAPRPASATPRGTAGLPKRPVAPVSAAPVASAGPKAASNQKAAAPSSPPPAEAPAKGQRPLASPKRPLDIGIK